MSGQLTEPCGYRIENGLWAPLVCGREHGHTGTHIDFDTYPNVSVGFGWDHGHPDAPDYESGAVGDYSDRWRSE